MTPESPGIQAATKFRDVKSMMTSSDTGGDLPDGQAKIEQIAAQLRDGHTVEPVTVRELLSWFGAKRRGINIAYQIREALYDNDLRTEPHFVNEYIDAPVTFKPGKRKGDIFRFSDDEDEATPTAEIISFSGSGRVAEGEPVITDPTYRIGRLRSANVAPINVSPNETIREAVTIMLANDFSQLPVMVGERDVKGMISWNSIGMRLALGVKCLEVRECMETPRVISADTYLFDAIGEIVRHQCVLIRDSTNKISGIVTTSDLSMQFQQLSEPFLLLGEIENHIRGLILKAKFSRAQLQSCSDPGDSGREVDKVFDLNFGEYIRLLEKEESWSQLALSLDRKIFVKGIEEVRQIRNEVMHFDPDGVTPEDLETLRKCAVFLQKLQLAVS